MAKKLDTIKLQEGIQVPHVNILTDFLIIRRSSVLFVGEGDFSFTVAFAALRESKKGPESHEGAWDGIIATCYEKHVPKYSEVIRICQYETCDDEAMYELSKRAPPPGSWLSDINACNLIKRLGDYQYEVVWFQCPWGRGSIYSLVRGFLRSASWRVVLGGYVCVGITKNPTYVQRYELEKILPQNAECDKRNELLQRYHFCGADTKLVKDVLAFGYHHQGLYHNQGSEDIHYSIQEDHVTLVFRKKPESD